MLSSLFLGQIGLSQMEQRNSLWTDPWEELTSYLKAQRELAAPVDLGDPLLCSGRCLWVLQVGVLDGK